jgi:glycosyltransferase involved in cell wall biosynthesis
VTPHLSLILPAYNGSRYIVENVRMVLAALEAMDEPFEVIVVCDGSSDGTANLARSVGDPRIRVLSYGHNEGKGHAICHGIASARGRLIGWLDSDLDIDPDVIVRAVRAFEDEPVDAVIGSKRARGSAVQYPWTRRGYSAGYQLLVRTLFRVNVRDTQVGAKVFRREMLQTVAPLLLIKRHAFDLEVLAVGAEFGFDRILEIPIRLDYKFTGTSINLDAVKRMFMDTLAIAYRIHLRHHYVRRFASLERQRADAVSPGEVAAEPSELPESARTAQV